jgi:hypothetical protein
MSAKTVVVKLVVVVPVTETDTRSESEIAGSLDVALTYPKGIPVSVPIESIDVLEVHGDWPDEEDTEWKGGTLAEWGEWSASLPAEKPKKSEDR